MAENRANDFEKDDYCCPGCGKETLWAEKGPGDYYLGPVYLCTNCDCFFSIQDIGVGAETEKAREQIKALDEKLRDEK